VDSVHDHGRSAALGELVGFRREFYASLTARADALFELTDAVLCTDGPVTSLPELSLSATHRRGHGALYDGLARGAVDVSRLRRALAGLELPRGADGGLRFAIDVTPWPRPDAECSPDRLHCHRNCRCDGTRKTIPGWPYSVIAALESGRSSWTAPVDLLRLGPDDDLTEITAAQVRDLIGRLIEAGRYSPGDPPVLIVLDSGYDLPRLSWLLSDLPVQMLGRIRSNRVFYGPPGPRRGQRPGRQPRHGHKFVLADAATHPQSELETPAHTTGSARCAPGHGRDCTPTWNAAGHGPTIPDHCRSSKPRSSASPSITYPATGNPNRCGCGPAIPSPARTTWTGSGAPTCAVSTWNTHSDSSSRPSGLPAHACARPHKPTGGHG
jgi:hypothetical protein